MNLINDATQPAHFIRRHATFGLFSLSLLLFSIEPIRKLIAVSGDGDNSHSSYVLLIPFISAVLIFFNRKSIFADLGSAFVPACAMFAFAAVLYYIERTNQQVLIENDAASLLIGA